MERRATFDIHLSGLTAGRAQEVRKIIEDQLARICPSMHYHETVGLIEIDSDIQAFEKAAFKELASDA